MPGISGTAIGIPFGGAPPFELAGEAPTWLTLSANTTTSLQLDWTSNSGGIEEGFIIERSDDNGVTYTAIDTVLTGIVTYTDGTLTEATTYYYRVRAFLGAVYSAYSNEAFSNTYPNAPTLLAAIAISNAQIDLEWVDNSAGETGFSIERSTNGVNYAEIDTVPANSVAYSDITCATDTLYYYRIMAYRDLYYSAYSNVASDSTFMIEAQDYIDRLIAVGDDPNVKRCNVINDLFVRIEGHNNLSKLDVLVLSGHDAAGSLLNWVKNAHNGTLTGTNYSELDYGWETNGTTGYIDTHYNARTEAVNYTLNSASFGMYFHTNVLLGGSGVNGAWSLTADGGSSNRTQLVRPTNGTSSINFGINGGYDNGTILTQNIGMFIITRTAANVQKYYINGVAKINGTAASTKIPNQNMLVGAMHDNLGNPVYFDKDWYGGYFFGSGMTQPDAENMTNDLAWYFAEILKVTYDEVYDTAPEDFYKTAVDAFIAQLVTDGTKALGDVMYLPLSNNEINDRVNILKPQVYKGALDNAAKYLINTKYNTSRGYLGCIATGFNPATIARNFKQNSACLAIYCDNVLSDNNVDMGFSQLPTSGSGTVAIIKHTDGKVYMGVNSGAIANTANANSTQGLYVFNRISATEIEWYYNGASQGIIANNSAAVDLRNLFLNAYITGANGTSRAHSLFFLGGKLSAGQILSMYNSFLALKTAIAPKMSAENSFERFIDNLGDNAYNSGTCTYNGKIYRVVMLNMGAYNQKYIYSITIATGVISTLYACGIATESNIDDHAIPAVVVDNSGYIYMCHEQQTGGGHESDFLIYKSDNPENMTAFTLFQEITGTFSYPVFKKIGNDIFLECRNGQYHDMYKKGILDANFSAIGHYCDVGIKVYTSIITNSNAKIGSVIELSDNADGGHSHNLWYVETTNGITWSNVSGSFTKNIVTSGAITLAELNANCLVVNDPTVAALLFSGGAVFKNGIPYILGRHMVITGANTADVNSMKVYYYSGGAWQNASFTDAALPYSFTYTGGSDHYLQYSDGLFNLFRITPTTGLIIKRYTSADAINWTDAGTFYSDNIAKFKQMSFVYDAGDDYFFCRKFNPNSVTQMAEIVKQIV